MDPPVNQEAKHPRQGSTAICHYDATRIFVRDVNLCDELIGKIGLTDYMCLLILGHRPNEAERGVIEAAMVALAEHGLTPSVIAARETYMGAPESFQGAVAAGILGVGDQFVGTVELVAPLLVEIVAHSESIDVAANAVVARYRMSKTQVPGFGQPHHKPDDPRSPALFAVGERFGLVGGHVAALKALGRAVDAALGRHLTINAPAAIASLFLEIGIPMRIMRGLIVVSRCIGLVAHLAEEQVNPSGRAMWDAAAHAVEYCNAGVSKQPQ
jgi:citrate synthase